MSKDQVVDEDVDVKVRSQATSNITGTRLFFLFAIVATIFCAAFLPVLFSKYIPVANALSWPSSTCTVSSVTVMSDRSFWTSWYYGQVYLQSLYMVSLSSSHVQRTA